MTGLSETDTVTARKDAKTIIGKWSQKPNIGYVVPDGYTQLEYIESTGTQYIDTGLSMPNGFRVVGDIKITDLSKPGNVIGAQKYTNGVYYRNMVLYGSTV